MPWYVLVVKRLGGLKKLSSLIGNLVNNGLSLLASCVTTTSKSRSTSLIKEEQSNVSASVGSGVDGSVWRDSSMPIVRRTEGKTVQLIVERFSLTPTCTLGRMTCLQAPWMSLWTLEPLRAIPAGTYDVTLYNSPHFGKRVPLLHDVDGYEAIEIHTGNYPRDTRGCILVGLTQNGSSIESSKLAFSLLMGVLDASDRISISIS